jgi:hypothetical protein
MPIVAETHPNDDTFEVTFRNSQTSPEATTSVTAPSIGDAAPLAKARIRSLPGLPGHVLWVIRNYDYLVVARMERKVPRRHTILASG